MMAVYSVLLIFLTSCWIIESCQGTIALFLENCLGVSLGRGFEDWFLREAPKDLVFGSSFPCGDVGSATAAAQKTSQRTTTGNETTFLLTSSLAKLLLSAYETSALGPVRPIVHNLHTKSVKGQRELRQTPSGLFELPRTKTESNSVRDEGDTELEWKSRNGLGILMQLFRQLDGNGSASRGQNDSKVVIYVYKTSSDTPLSSSGFDLPSVAAESTSAVSSLESCRLSDGNSCTDDDDDVLSRSTYRIAVVERPPYIMFDVDDSNKVINPEELIVKMLDSLAAKLGFRYTLKPHFRHGKVVPNGTWNGAIGALLRKEVDMCAGDFSLTQNRSEVVDFTTPFMHSTEALVIRRTMMNPSIRDLLRTHLRPFHWSIWLTMGGCWVTATVLMVLTIDPVTSRPFLKVLRGRNVRLDDQHAKDRDTWLTILFQLLGILCQQGCSLAPKRTSGRVTFFTICLMALVCYNFYTSVFISFTTVSRRTVPINNLADILRDESFEVGFVQGDMAEEMFMYSEVPAYMKVWSRLQRSDRTYVLDVEEGMSRAYMEKFAFIADLHCLEWYALHNCSFKLLQDRVLSDGYHFLLPKNSPDTKVFSKYLKLFAESGLVTRLLAGVMPPMTTDYCEGGHTLEAVGLDRMAGLFLCLALGFAVAMISLWLERVGVDEGGTNKRVTITLKTKSKF